jgi:hypothetical protein
MRWIEIPLDVRICSAYKADMETSKTIRSGQFRPSPKESAMFSRSAFFVKTASEWAARAPRRSVESAAKEFARRNMIAVVLLGNDDAVAYLYDAASDRVAKEVHRKPEWRS